LISFGQSETLVDIGNLLAYANGDPGRVMKSLLEEYRIYFLGATGRIDAAHSFEADCDESALWIAEHLSQVCSDVCPSFELWHRARKISGGEPVALPDEAATAQREEMLVRQLEALRSSPFFIAKGPQLAEALERIRRP
jgi:hypothetical protein